MSFYFNFIKKYREEETSKIGRRYIKDLQIIVVKNDNKVYTGAVDGYFWYKYNDKECFLDLYPTEQSASDSLFLKKYSEL